MTDLPEIALSFVRECMGWQDCKPSAMRRETIMYRSNFSRVGPKEAFPYTDLNAVMDAVRSWWQSIGGEKVFAFTIALGNLLDVVSVNRRGDDENRAGIATAPCDNLCFGLMATCLEAARKLKENVA